MNAAQDSGVSVSIDAETNIVTFSQNGVAVFRVALEDYAEPLDMPAKLTIEMVDEANVASTSVSFLARNCFNIEGARHK